MQRLDLNLASNPFRNNSLLWVGYGTASVLLVLFSVWNITTFVDYRARLLELRDTVGTFQTQRLELETRGQRALVGIRRFDVDSLELKTNKANEVIEWKAFSWTRLFNTLERVLPYQVRMNSVRPIFIPSGARQDQGETQAGAMPVAIEGTAKTFDDLAELQRAFLADPQIGRVEPERLDKTENGEFAFQLRFTYVPVEEGRNVAEPQPGKKYEEADEVTEVAVDDPTDGDAVEAAAEEIPLPPGMDGTTEPELDSVASPDTNSAAVEVTDPGPPGRQEIDREAVGAPASKAKRGSAVRPRPDARGRQPVSRDKSENKEEEDQP